MLSLKSLQSGSSTLPLLDPVHPRKKDAPDAPECILGEKKGKGCASCTCSDFGQWLCTGYCPPGM